MPANNDKFKKVASNTGWQVGGSGIADAVVTTAPLVSANGLPSGTGVRITIDRVDAGGAKTPSKMERIDGVVSGNNIINCLRGAGGTAQAHSAGAKVEIMISAENWNEVMDGILAEHNQDGSHKISALDAIRYAADGGASDAYAITLVPAPAAYYVGMVVNFKANTANTLDASLNVNGLGAKTIKKNVSSDLATGDILAGQLITVIYDGTNFQMVTGIPALDIRSGWIPANESWAYASANTITVPSGALSKYSVGDYIKWTQTTGKYGHIIAIADTLLTILGDAVANAAISANSYSKSCSPTELSRMEPVFVSINSLNQTVSASPTDITGLTTGAITIPAGGRRIKITVQFFMTDTGTGGSVDINLQEDGTDVCFTRYDIKTANNSYTHTFIFTKIASAGSHTYKVRCNGTTTSKIYADASAINYILVEQM